MIKELLEKILCKHKWEEFESVSIFGNTFFLEEDKRPVGVRKTLICKECGKIKKITL